MAGLGAAEQARVLKAVRERIASFRPDHPPVEMARDIHALVRSVSGMRDPYACIKRDSNEVCRSCMPLLRRRMTESSDSLLAAVKLAIAGNVIDFGAFSATRVVRSDVVHSVEAALSQPLSGDRPDDLLHAAEEAETILYIADNAGECFFDRPLLERLPVHKLTYAVRGGPVLNDATLDDAHAAGIQNVCRILDTGDCAPGIVLDRCSSSFVEAFERSDLVIAKGQGNYESLSECRDRTYVFLTKVKCDVIARDIGFPVGSNVVRVVRPQSPTTQERSRERKAFAASGRLPDRSG